MKALAFWLLVSSLLQWGKLIRSQNDTNTESNRFRDIETVVRTEMVRSSEWATGFCGGINATNPLEPAAIWNGTFSIRSDSLQMINFWGDAVELTQTGVQGKSTLVQDMATIVKREGEMVVLHMCVGMKSGLVRQGLELKDVENDLETELAIDFTYDALEIHRLGYSFPPRYLCSETDCQAPDCFCASKLPPKDSNGRPLNPSKVPQFIVVTVEDAVNDVVWNGFIEDLVTLNARDSIGCRPRFTFFVSNLYTNYHRVQTLKFMDQELGLHTVDNEYKEERTVREWAQQVQAGLFWMERLVEGVTREEVAGFRAPYLAYTEKLFTALKRQGIMYDSSFVPKTGRYWPFTLDAGAPDCLTTSKCPLPITGLWEFPLNYLEGADYPLDPAARWASDPSPEDGSPDAIRDLLALNFDAHYNGYRAPLGIHINSGWIVSGHAFRKRRERGVMDFLRFAATQPDVVFATPSQVISWMKNPTTNLKDLRDRPEFACPKFPWPVKRNERTCDGRDDNGDLQVDEGLVHLCRYTNPGLSFSSCKSCPRVYPNVEGPPVSDCQLDSSTVEWWCERNGGYEMGDPSEIVINGTISGLGKPLLDRLARTDELCKSDNPPAQIACRGYSAVVRNLADDSLTRTNATDEAIPPAAEMLSTDEYEPLEFPVELMNLTAAINNTEWLFYNISSVLITKNSSKHYVTVGDILGRISLNFTGQLSPETMRIKLEGRFFKPRRGPTVSITGIVNPSTDPPSFRAMGTFNYPLYGPRIPEEDPRRPPAPPRPPGNDDYDYDDDYFTASPPRPEGDRGNGSPPPPPPPPSNPDSASKRDKGHYALAVFTFLMVMLGIAG